MSEEGNPQDSGVALETQPVDWQSHIPKEYAKEKLWDPIKGQDLSVVLKGYAESQKRMGNSIPLPNKDDDKEGWDKVYSKLDWPKEAKEYDYDTSKWQDQFEFDQEALDRFKQAAHANRLGKKQYNQMMDWYITEVVGKQKAAMDKDAEQVAILETKLKQEMGPNYEYNKAIALKGLYEYTKDQEAVEMLAEVMKRNETIARAFMKLGQEMVEHRRIEGDRFEQWGAVDPKAALD